MVSFEMACGAYFSGAVELRDDVFGQKRRVVPVNQPL